ncbi:MAG: PKD domain-containing protein [Candidatus Helarchaeota archaeon]
MTLELDLEFINYELSSREHEFQAIVNPVDLDFLQYLELIGMCGIFNLEILETRNYVLFNATDDDGGNSIQAINFIKQGNHLKISGLSPDFQIIAPNITIEDTGLSTEVLFSDYNETCYFIDNKSMECEYEIIYDFGDGTIITGNFTYVEHNYTNTGYYLLKVLANNGASISRHSLLIKIINIPPNIGFVDGNTNISEDNILKLKLNEIFDTKSDISTLKYFIDYKDGFVSYKDSGKTIQHIYRKSGNYNLTIKCIDDNGYFMDKIINIEVENRPPILSDIFKIEGLEGNVIICDPIVYDSLYDRQHLTYQWIFDSTIITKKQLNFWSPVQQYKANLTVIDFEGSVFQYNTTISFLNYPTQVITNNYIFYGAEDYIQLEAYALDAFTSIPNLRFEWRINSSQITNGYGITSSVEAFVNKTGFYLCTVEIFDEMNKGYGSNFQITSSIDSDGDNLPDIIEEIYDISDEDEDSDGDHITDWYEINIYGTDPGSIDTDGDGLVDGYCPELGIYGIGELLIGTDPLSQDTDNDNLSDYIEYFGWNITTDFYYLRGI